MPISKRHPWHFLICCSLFHGHVVIQQDTSKTKAFEIASYITFIKAAGLFQSESSLHIWLKSVRLPLLYALLAVLFATRPEQPGISKVSAGAAVITPQRRSDRAPQGSPLVFRRPWGSIFKPPRSRRARNATSGIKDSLIAPKQLVHHLPGCFFLAPSLTRSYTGYVPLILCIQLSWCLKETVRNLRPSMCRRWESLFVKHFLNFFWFFSSSVLLHFCYSLTFLPPLIFYSLQKQLKSIIPNHRY